MFVHIKVSHQLSDVIFSAVDAILDLNDVVEIVDSQTALASLVETSQIGFNLHSEISQLGLRFSPLAAFGMEELVNGRLAKNLCLSGIG